MGVQVEQGMEPSLRRKTSAAPELRRPWGVLKRAVQPRAEEPTMPAKETRPRL